MLVLAALNFYSRFLCLPTRLTGPVSNSNQSVAYVATNRYMFETIGWSNLESRLARFPSVGALV